MTTTHFGNDDDEQPQRCGTFLITFTHDELTAFAVTVDDLPRCDNDEDDDVAG